MDFTFSEVLATHVLRGKLHATYSIGSRIPTASDVASVHTVMK